MRRITVSGLQFACDDPIEAVRAKTLMTKEPGTIAWLQRVCRPDDVLWDIGANIGLYSLFAVWQMGQTGRVCAFEPSPSNAAALLRNVALNGMAEQIRVLTVALNDEDGLRPFHLVSMRPGASGHQLADRPGEIRATEWKLTVRGDALVTHGGLPTPSLLKLDVDGREPHILRGFAETLRMHLLRSLQVEIQPDTVKTVADLLETAGYQYVERHDTASGRARIAAGADPADVAHNTIWELPA